MSEDRAALPFAVALLLAGCGSRSGIEQATETSPGSTTSSDPTTSATDPTTGTDDPCAFADADGDGHAAIECGGDDCEDGDATIHPGAPDNTGQWTLSTVDAGPATFRSVALALDAAG